VANTELDEVRGEILSALETFMGEGFATSVGFGIVDGKVTAELYGPAGNIVETYDVTITVEKREP
jgi:hypothetical protein